MLLHCLTLPGMAMNAFLFYAILRHHRMLQGTCHYLLALESLLEVCHQSAHLLFLAVTVSATNSIHLGTSIRFQTLGVFGLCAVYVAMAALALDRLFFMLAPRL